MIFNSFLFVTFLIVVLVVWALPMGWTARKVALLAFSYLFYAAWNPPFVVLIWASTLIDFACAKAMTRAATQRGRRGFLLLSLGFNLGILGYYKYLGFFERTLADLGHGLGLAWTPSSHSIVLPVGISFYTFQTLSYILDVYHRRSPPARSLLDYALFVTFFPHLVAGPIMRNTTLLPQFEQPRRTTGNLLGWGLTLLALGLFEKVVLADGLLAPAVEHAFAPTLLEPSTADAWTGALAFAGQIVCDFAGYSTCAIGVAFCLGFRLPDNFRFPYAAVGFSDFWRRWHISLSSWLRDYVYIPLGGNRRGPRRALINLMLTMLIGGLWHGAAWTFVVWGALHGLYLVGERLVKALTPPWVGWQRAPSRFLLGALTFVLVCVAWVFFRASSCAQAVRLVEAMFGQSDAATSTDRYDRVIALFVVGCLVLTHIAMRNTRLETLVERTPAVVRGIVIAFFIVSILLMPGIDRAFLYFQF